MRIRHSLGNNQLPKHRRLLFFLLFLLIISLVFPLIFSGCRRSSEELPVTPPATNPLTREYIGYGVVNVSFTHLRSESGPSGVSQGYLRRGTVVRIIERVKLANRGNSTSWVLAESNYRIPGTVSSGWLEEADLVIYENEDQANTASKTLNQ